MLPDSLHIISSGLDSTYVSEEMSELRGKLKATFIKLIVVRRAYPHMVPDLVKQFKKSISDLVAKTQVTGIVSLKEVSGHLRPDSYRTVPARVCHYCKQSLLESLHNGIDVCSLQENLGKKTTGKPHRERVKDKKTEGKTSSHSSTPRKRRASSMYLFLPHS